MSNQDFISFDHALQKMHLPIENLRIEEIITSSMNNYVVNVNCNGSTWALGIRYPKHLDVEKYVREKLQTTLIANYLSDIFENGVSMDENNTFIFSGRSYLCESTSVKRFVHKQANDSPIIIIDSIRNKTKEIKGLTINSEHIMYNGPYFITKGAPANETLEHAIEFAHTILKATAVLHTHTGAKKISSPEFITEVLENIYHDFVEQVDAWTPSVDSSEAKRILEYKEKYDNTKDVEMNIKREVFLQSNESTSFLNTIIKENFHSFLSDPDYLSFVHGDAHGANFIIVQYMYKTIGQMQIFLDRILLNELFNEIRDLEKVTICYDSHKNSTEYRDYENGDEEKIDCVVAYRYKHNEVHVIDIDTGKGISNAEKKSYYYDLVTLCLSIKNWLGIHSVKDESFSEIVSYYIEEFSKQSTLRTSV